MKPVDGTESLLCGVTVRDFWAWAMGNLRLNATRGMLAQFLVARAVDDTRPMDDGWGNFDVLSSAGIRIEVKSSAYLPSWPQRRPSKITFSGLTGLSWDAATSDYSAVREVRADVYVFAVQTCMDHTAYDPLHLASWDFYVAPGSTILAAGSRSLSLSRVPEVGVGPIPWDELGAAIRAAHSDAT